MHPRDERGVHEGASSKDREISMAKGEQKGNKEARKPKKAAPPKQNASNPSMKGADKSKSGQS
jgi:hypothetical protein